MADASHFAFPHLALVDLAIILFYLVANSVIGFVSIRRHKDKRSDAEEFILAGRSLTLPAFVATLVSTWYGGIIGVGEYAYDKGIVMWVVFGIPYYFAALFYAFVLAKKVNDDREHSTISDRLRTVYGNKAGYIGAIVVFFMTSPAPYIMTLGTLYEWFFGITPMVGVGIAIVSSILYLFTGGFRASVQADMLQFVLMFLGFAVILPYAYSTFGGWGYITSHVPAGHLQPFGTNSLWYILVWYIIAMSTLVDPNVNTRVFAARNVSVAKWGVVISVVFWLFFDLMTNLAGLYARAAFATLPASKFAYPALAERVLPIGMKGVFYTGMLATVLSTVDSFLFTSATIVGRDILWRWRGGGDESTVKRYTRFGLFITAAISLIIIACSDRIYVIWYAFGSILVPALLFPLTLSYFPKLRPTPRAARISMMVGGLSSLTAYVVGVFRSPTLEPNYLLGMEPLYVGLILSLGVLVVSRFLPRAVATSEQDISA
jgi:SSS family solute:Na+ symporter